MKSLLELRQENVVIQKWDLSCGAGVIATLLNYGYDDRVSERDIAKALIKREEYLEHPELIRVQQGFSLLDLKRYVEGRGYQAVGYGKMTLQDLIERAPIMVPINANGYNHFVIFRGVWGDRVLLADPAWGNRTMTVDKFESLWLDYPDFGKVGFVVERREDGATDNRLAPRAARISVSADNQTSANCNARRSQNARPGEPCSSRSQVVLQPPCCSLRSSRRPRPMLRHERCKSSSRSATRLFATCSVGWNPSNGR